jgi:catabolite regulation protein CreA
MRTKYEDALHTRVALLFISYSVTRVFEKSNRDLEYVIFKISVTSKNVINLIIRTFLPRTQTSL